MWALLLGGAALRLALYIANPAANAFDNHFEPVLLIISDGIIPAKDACWSCYHPPLLYWSSAMLGKLFVQFNMSAPTFFKVLQGLSCLFGIATLVFVWAILKRLPLNDFARAAGLGIICFLPRHIYMSAMYSNDAIAYMLVTICLYLLLVALDRGFSWRVLVLLSISMGLALLTKVTALVVLPTVGFVFFMAFVWGRVAPRRDTLIKGVAVMIFPLALLATEIGSNMKTYGEPFPINMTLSGSNVVKRRPGAGGVDFFDFRPLSAIKDPVIRPSNIDSFWTMLYGRMWFDMEPLLIYPRTEELYQKWHRSFAMYLESHIDDWTGQEDFPQGGLNVGRALIALGLLPLIIFLAGLCYAVWGRWSIRAGPGDRLDAIKLMAFPVLLLVNIAGVVKATLAHPYYATMKAAYLLNSVAAFAVIFALGAMWLGKGRTGRTVITVILAAVFALVTVHIIMTVTHLALYPHSYS